MAKVRMTEVTRFVTDCVVAAGSPRKPAEQLADLLLAADKCGHRSHGLNRLERYIRDILAGLCNPFNTPKILNETASTAWVNANNVLGATAGNFGTDLAIKKATDTGVGCISVKGSNHFGIGGYWAKKLSDSGMIGLIFTNGSPLVAPTRGTKAALGSNPLAAVGPGLPSTGPFYLDISTATVALGKLEMCRRRGIKLQPGWAQGPDGRQTLDPDLAIKSGCLLPLGGTEQTGGYKGFGLGALVDMLSGLLSGGNYGHHVPRWTPTVKTKANIGQTFLAINHKCFAPGFEERVSDVIQYWRNMKPADPKFPVLAPGDIEKMSIIDAEESGVIVYMNQMLESCDRLAAKLKVQPIQRIKVCHRGSNPFDQLVFGENYVFIVQLPTGLWRTLDVNQNYVPL